jgi:hypothetical protein
VAIGLGGAPPDCGHSATCWLSETAVVVFIFLSVFLEGAMNTQTSPNGGINIVALGWALSAALIILFVMCLVLSFLYPEVPASKGWEAWIALFSVTSIEHPISSIRVWIDGIAFSLVFGWITAAIFGLIYNRLIRR